MDGYAYELAAEQATLHKAVHAPMRAFFRTFPHLAAQYGEFPQFWKDLAGWAAFKDVYRVFQRYQDAGVAPLPLDAAQPASPAPAAAAMEVEAPTAPPVPLPTAPSEPIVDAAAGKKRRRRWEDAGTEDAAPAPAPAAAPAPAPAPAAPAPTKRRNRWEASYNDHSAFSGAPAAPRVFEGGTLPPPQLLPTTRLRTRFGQRIMPSTTTLLPPEVHVAQEALFVLRVRMEEVAAKLLLLPADAKRQAADPDRPPSPPPEYDSNGKRTNALDQRLRAAQVARRDGLIERIMDLNPALCGTHGPRFLRKRYIPWREYPNVNFLGLVIGPRGNTQKRLEKETNCKVSVRGQGNGRDVKLRSEGTMDEVARRRAQEEEDDLHVAIIGERLSEVEMAAALVEDMLHPKEDDDGEWKKVQLMELAAYNGMLQELNAPCRLCGETGHKNFECPYRDANAKRANVRCAICGDASHVTSDCKLKERPQGDDALDPALDSEYMSFMAELGDESAKAMIKHSKGAGALPVAAPPPLPEMPASGTAPMDMDDDAPPGMDAPAYFVPRPAAAAAAPPPAPPPPRPYVPPAPAPQPAASYTTPYAGVPPAPAYAPVAAPAYGMPYGYPPQYAMMPPGYPPQYAMQMQQHYAAAYMQAAPPPPPLPTAGDVGMPPLPPLPPPPPPPPA